VATVRPRTPRPDCSTDRCPRYAGALCPHGDSTHANGSQTVTTGKSTTRHQAGTLPATMRPPGKCVKITIGCVELRGYRMIWERAEHDHTRARASFVSELSGQEGAPRRYGVVMGFDMRFVARWQRAAHVRLWICPDGGSRLAPVRQPACGHMHMAGGLPSEASFPHGFPPGAYRIPSDKRAGSDRGLHVSVENDLWAD
jgi:hypothetical protein